MKDNENCLRIDLVENKESCKKWVNFEKLANSAEEKFILIKIFKGNIELLKLKKIKQILKKWLHNGNPSSGYVDFKDCAKSRNQKK